MSKAQFKEISISELVEESNLIVEVEFIETYVEEVPVVNRDVSNLSGEAIPPFQKKGNVFKIKSILKNKDKINVPEKITVPDEDWRRALNKHKEKYLKAPSKSYHLPEYISEVKSAKKATILFLHHFQNMYELTARNSFEDQKSFEKVTILLENTRY